MAWTDEARAASAAARKAKGNVRQTMSAARKKSRTGRPRYPGRVTPAADDIITNASEWRKFKKELGLAPSYGVRKGARMTPITPIRGAKTVKQKVLSNPYGKNKGARVRRAADARSNRPTYPKLK